MTSNDISLTNDHASQGICKDWLLLDSQSTVDLFCNPSLLPNIRTVDDELIVNCNAGTTTINQVGVLE